MNAGGDPERDDFGLPPVDIEIPDDARELDRDVHAYHRELRALRRQRLARRLHGPLTRDGMILPLLAGCMVLALITGTLLTLFAAGQADMPQQPQRGAGPTQSRVTPSSRPTAGQVGALLPAGTVVIGGRNVPLRSLKPSVLALVLPGCQCVPALSQLVSEAGAAGVPLYLVETGSRVPGLARLASGAGPAATVADDTGRVLAAFQPSGSGLTAILVRSSGTVARVVPPSGLRGRADVIRLKRAFLALGKARTQSLNGQRTAATPVR